jgi:hypothetical protein
MSYSDSIIDLPQKPTDSAFLGEKIAYAMEVSAIAANCAAGAQAYIEREEYRAALNRLEQAAVAYAALIGLNRGAHEALSAVNAAMTECESRLGIVHPSIDELMAELES